MTDTKNIFTAECRLLTGFVFRLLGSPNGLAGLSMAWTGQIPLKVGLMYMVFSLDATLRLQENEYGKSKEDT